ncbi:hypothetical protein Tco_0332811 [Tanacetum coccineum]
MATVRRFVPASIGDEFSDSQAISSDWSYVSEPMGISSNDAFNRPELLEQINTTADHSDYLCTDIKGDKPFLNDASQITIHVKSLGHVLHFDQQPWLLERKFDLEENTPQQQQCVTEKKEKKNEHKV